MLVIKRCKCGSTQFEREFDDDVLRCSECFSRAEYSYIEDKKEESE